MREVVDKRLRGQFEYDNGSLTFSEQRLEIALDEGTDAEGSFVIYGPADRMVEGVVSSTELRMSVLTPSFSGSHDSISYHFHSEGLKGGDVLQGYFRIISNQGEYQLPFVVSVQINHIASDMGDIRNLFHFTNLARSDYQAAVDLFYDERFASLLTGNDAVHLGLYRGLSADVRNAQNMEEFLLAVNKKQKTEFLPDRKMIELNNPYGDQEFLLHISRNGWGYTFLQVEADGDFIELTDRTITEADFLNNSVSYRFTVRYDKLHPGTNFGRVKFSNAFTGFDVEVQVASPTLTSDERDYQHDLYELLRLYESYRLKQMDMGAWLDKSEKVLTKMNALHPEDPQVRLYRAHYLVTAGRAKEAQWILQQYFADESKVPDERLSCYATYLSVLADMEGASVEDALEQLHGALVKSPNDWRLNWLLLYLSEEYSVSRSKKWHLLQELYDTGCRSPFVYLEALQTLNAYPGALRQMDGFGTALLQYAVKHNAVSKELSDHLCTLLTSQKELSASSIDILMALYDKNPSQEVLSALCASLIHAGRTDEAAFPYYAEGVEADLKITRLYEYYMQSVPLKEDGSLPDEIPRVVLMYYAYQTSLGFERTALLYHYLYEHRAQYPELYESYRPHITEFLSDQVAKRHTNAHLSVLYRALMTREMVNKDNAYALLQVLNTAQISVQDTRIERVIVRYARLTEEREYPVTKGRAYVPLYGNEYTLLLADRNDNRYAVSVPHENIKLIVPGHLSTFVTPYLVAGEESIDLFLTEQGSGGFLVTEENLNRYKDLVDADVLTTETRTLIRTALLRFYYEKDYISQLSEILEEIRPEALAAKERNAVLDMMILAGMYEKALSWLKTYGTFEVDPKTVVRLFTRMLDKELLPEEAAVTEIAFFAFRKGKYDERLLTYLTQSFTGLVKEMRDIWKASAGFSIDTYAVCERILIQMLYSGAYTGDRMHIFRDYVTRTGNADVEVAFLSQCAYDSFVKERVMEEYIFERIARQHTEGSRLDKVCKLAYLKHFAESKISGVQPEKEVVREFLQHLTKEKMYFAFYQDYADALPQMVTYADKTIIEYRTRPGNRCVLHFLDAEDAAGSVYKSVAMKEQYDGIYVASFTLFFGEQVQYYITESSGVREEVTESGTITKNDIAQTTQAGRFNLINDICIAEALHDYETVDRLLEEYYRRQFITGKLFLPYKET